MCTWGRSAPEIINGYCGLERSWTSFACEFMEELQQIHNFLFVIEDYPHTKFQIEWSRFVADRHAIQPNFGCKISNANYPGIITTEHKNHWNNVLYPDSEDSKQKFITMGQFFYQIKRS